MRAARRPRRRLTADPAVTPLAEPAPADHIEADGADPVGEPDGEPDREPREGPHRRCIVTRQTGLRASMLRFVVSPDGMVVPDLSARLPGRGIWLSARADVLDSPRLHQAFSRAARRRVEVPDRLAGLVVAGLRQRIGALIGFARRAGQAVAGYQKAHEWLVAGRAVLMIEASDGSADERRRLIGGRGVAVITPLPAAALGRVFGRDSAVHVAVSAGKLAGLLQIEAARLMGLAADGPDGLDRPEGLDGSGGPGGVDGVDGVDDARIEDGR